MIATGNHSDSDSLRGAPPSLNPSVPGLQLRCRISAVSNKSSDQLSCVEGGSRPSPTVMDYAVIASQFENWRGNPLRRYAVSSISGVAYFRYLCIESGKYLNKNLVITINPCGQIGRYALLLVMDNAAMPPILKEVKYYGFFFFRRDPSQRK